MSAPLTAPTFQTDRGRKLTLLALRLITLAMIYLFGEGLRYAARRFSTTSQEDFLPLMLTLVSLVAMLTYVRTRGLEGRERTLFRVSELVTIAVLLKGFFLLQDKELVLSSELTSWQNDFLMSFLNGYYILHLILVMGMWWVTSYLMTRYDELHDRELDAIWEDAGKLSNSLKHIRSQMIAVMVTLLIFLIVITTVSSAAIEIPDLISFEASGDNPTWLVMLFAVLLMIQFSLTQFILLRARWELDRTDMTRAVPRQWLFYGLIFLAIMGVFAALLPTRYSISFFDLIGMVITFFTRIIGFILYLLTLPFLLLMRLLSRNQETPPTESSVPDLPTLPSQTNAPPEAQPFFEVLRIILFWGAFSAIIGFAFYQLVTANKDVWKALASFPFFRWLSNLFQELKVFFGAAGQALQEQIKRIHIPGLQRPGIRLSANRQPLSPKDPRGRIIVLYKSMVEYAGDQGIRRRDHQTPYQYQEQLGGKLPDVSGEVSDVTQGFVEARYSLHALDEETVDRLLVEYTRIRDSLNNQEPPE